MKLSLYSYLFTRSNHYYLYNSETGFFSEISESLYKELYNGNFNNINPDTVQKLIEQKIILKKEALYDYYNKQKQHFLSTCYNQEKLSLTIVPTTGCNFACPYCFEGEKHRKTISDETISSLIAFINSHEKAKTLSLTWYGGEPLLAFKKIKELLNRIKQETRLPILKQGIITNGYLIDNEVIQFFVENKFQFIQITLDGIKEHHDQTRYLKHTHQPTFDTIVSNIQKVAAALPLCKISIRVNINKKNSGDFILIHNMLTELITSKNINVYPGFIREETTDGCKLCYDSISESTELYTFYKEAEQNDFKEGFKLKHKSKGCIANYLNAYIIGPDGEIYKCWNDVNHPERIVGYIQEKKLRNETLFYNYLNESTPFELQTCKNCLSFPICTAGCAWFHYKNKFENKQFNICDMTKNKTVLENILLSMAEKSTQKPTK